MARLQPSHVAKWGGGAILTIIILFTALLLSVQSDFGKRMVTDYLRRTHFSNGLNISIDRIDGSMLGAMTLHGVVLGDVKGPFVHADTVDVDWRPLSYLSNHISVHRLASPLITVSRKPEFAVSPTTKAPLLPDIDIDVDRAQFDKIVLAAPVLGRQQVAQLNGGAHILNRRAQVALDVSGISTVETPGGDHLSLKLDAAPDQNILNIEGTLKAPENGILAGMTGLNQALSAQISGRGTWHNWQGALTVVHAGARAADLKIVANDGAVDVTGPLKLDGLYTGVGAPLLSRALETDIHAQLAQRRVTLTGTLHNEYARLTTQGTVDFGQSLYNGLAIALSVPARLKLADKSEMTGLMLHAKLDGAFEAPQLAYTANANTLTVNTATFVDVRALGAGMLSSHAALPLQARVAQVRGLNASVGKLLDNVAVSGTLALTQGRIISDNLSIRSRQLTAKAVLIADPRSGHYTGALQGQVNGYEIGGLGTFMVSSNAKLSKLPNGLLITGTAKLLSKTFSNSGAAAFLGGTVLTTSDISYADDGVWRASNVHILSPRFRMSGARGSYAANGTLDFVGQGVSTQYGPLGIAVSGTFIAPVAKIVAPRPGLGLGLVKVTAFVRKQGLKYVINATADSDYGPVLAAFDLLNVGSQLNIDVHPVRVSGVDMSGHLVSSGGTYAGRLLAAGGGINGTIDLGNVGHSQSAHANLTALNARFAGAAHLTVGRALLVGDAIFTPQPKINADIQLSNTRLRTLHLTRARATLTEQAGTGTVHWLAEGESTTPFRIAGNAALTPKLWRVALAGTLDGVAFQTQNPAEIDLLRQGYHLRPVNISSGGGTLQLSGNYGAGVRFTAALDRFDIAIFNPVFSDLGVAGRASSVVTYAQPNMAAGPVIDAKLQIAGFTRTTLAIVSRPVDISAVAALNAVHGELRTLIKRGNDVIGQAQVQLAPHGQFGSDWTSALASAALSGGVRYNGPAEILSSALSLSDQSLSGPVIVAADVRGSFGTPKLNGIVRSATMVYQNATYGTKLTQIALNANFSDDQLNVTSLTAKAGNGNVHGEGFISLSSQRGYPAQLNLKMDNAELANGDGLRAAATGALQVVNAEGGVPKVTGTITVPGTRYQLVQQGTARVPMLTGVRRTTDAPQKAKVVQAASISSLTGNTVLDVHVNAGNQIYVSGFGLNSEWSSNVHVTGTATAPLVSGRLDLIRGTLGFAGHSFDLQDGRISFVGGSATEGQINLVGTTDIDGVTITLTIQGAAYDPQISFSSSPALPQDEIMARILFGNSVGQISAIQALQLASSLNSLKSGGRGLNPLGVLQTAAGIDRLRVVGADATTGQGVSLAAGKYITRNVFVEIVADARGNTATQLEITLARGLALLGQASSFGTSNIKLRYHRDY